MEVTSTLIEAHIFRKTAYDIEFLLLKRSKEEIYPGIWQMVTGSIQLNEKAFQTAMREIKEETDLNPKDFWIVPTINSYYSPEKDLINMVPVFSALVDPKCSVKISNEHSEFGWFKKEEAKKLLAWEGQRKSVDIIYEYFTNEKSFFEFVRIN